MPVRFHHHFPRRYVCHQATSLAHLLSPCGHDRCRHGFRRPYIPAPYCHHSPRRYVCHQVTRPKHSLSPCGHDRCRHGFRRSRPTPAQFRHHLLRRYTYHWATRLLHPRFESDPDRYRQDSHFQHPTPAQSHQHSPRRYGSHQVTRSPHSHSQSDRHRCKEDVVQRPIAPYHHQLPPILVPPSLLSLHAEISSCSVETVLEFVKARAFFALIQQRCAWIVLVEEVFFLQAVLQSLVVLDKQRPYSRACW